MIDLDALKAAALAATPGARKFEPHPYGYGYSVLWVPETRAEILVTGGRNDGDDPITWMGEELTDGDRQFMEATDPAAILSLIARLRDAEADAARLRHIRDSVDFHQNHRGDTVLKASAWCFANRHNAPTLEDRQKAWTAAIDAAMKEQGAAP